MAIENLDNGEREFLQTFFNNAAKIFTPDNVSELSDQEKLGASVMAWIFSNAVKQAKYGDLEAVNTGVRGAVTAVKSLNEDGELQPMAAELLKMESFFYAVTPEKNKAGLGTYKNKMF